MPAERGQSAVVVPVPNAEPVVSAWRERFDGSAALGMPAHITVLYPFLSEQRLADGGLHALRDLCAESPTLDVEFTCTGRFPGVLYLAPEPASGLRELTAKFAERWPEAPPYAGRFEEVVPYLTVAHGTDEDVLAEAEEAVMRGLPLRAWLVEARLYVFEDGRWQQRARLPFGFRDS
jgi:2'-5' RNA ligase superfamily